MFRLSEVGGVLSVGQGRDKSVIKRNCLGGIFKRKDPLKFNCWPLLLMSRPGIWMIIKKAKRSVLCPLSPPSSTQLYPAPSLTKDDPGDTTAAFPPLSSLSLRGAMAGRTNKPVLKLKDMEEKHLHNLFLKNMSGLIEEVKNPTPRLNP